MKPVLIFRHVDVEGPGYLQAFLEQRGIPFEIVRIDAGDPVPDSAGTASGLVFMGGPMSVNDPLDWIARELALIRDAMEEGVPVLGHCLGGQMIARALGAGITANPVREIGWHVVECLDNPETRAWFGDDPGSFDCFHWHGERFSLPEGAVSMLSSGFCENQCFVSGGALAMQCHIEMTPELIRTWSRRFADQLATPSASVQSAGQMLENLEERIGILNRVADHVYEHWVKGLAGCM